MKKSANEPTKVLSLDFACSKLAKTLVVPISAIEYDQAAVDSTVLTSLESSVTVPWGKLLMPVLVSALPEPQNGKTYKLRHGVNRLALADKLGFSEIAVVVLEGTENQIQLLARDSKMIRRRMNAYQQMQN